MQRLSIATLVFFATLLAPLATAQRAVQSTATSPTINFESGATRPLLLSPDGSELYVLNTSDHRVEIYATGTSATVPHRMGLQHMGVLTHLGSVFTGLEPVSMVLHPDDPDTLFVANLVSDSVAVVDLHDRQVVATIPVGDEPQDIAIADGQLVVACARSAGTPDLVAPTDWIENAVVFVDAAPPYDVLARVGIPGHKPRALAVVDGVAHVVPVNSGNHTTILSGPQVNALGMTPFTKDAFDPDFDFNAVLLAPGLMMGGFTLNIFGINGWAVPGTGRIVFDSEYPGVVPQLDDIDVHGIDLATHALRPGGTTGVGTNLLGMTAHPETGALWVAGTDARNRSRFEPSIKGAAMDNQVAIVARDGTLSEIVRLAPPLTTREHAQPVAVAFSRGPFGRVAFVAAMGTSTVVALDSETGALVAELDTGPLPLGLAVDDTHGLLYVYTLGDKTVRAYRIAPGLDEVRRPRPLAYDAEPKGVTTGRIHMYDARASTGAGSDNFSCASCHVFGHMDGMAWDLGDPEGGTGYFYPDLVRGQASLPNTKLAIPRALMTHPMKGPMVTQSLRGLGDETAAPFHWRGDRRFFQMFRGAFEGLLGGDGISPGAMQEYTTFVRSMVFPPNPYQPRDRTYAGSEANGADLYGMNPTFNGKTYNPQLPGVSCVDCHAGDFFAADDFTGSQKTVNFDGFDQMFNSAGMRGIYEKEFQSLTGFGVSHDGAMADLRAFLDGTPGGMSAFPGLTPSEKNDVAAFMRAWDTGISPLVGVQHTVSPRAPDVDAWRAFLDLAEQEATPPQSNVDLIAKVGVTLHNGRRLNVGLHYTADPADGVHRYRSDSDLYFDRATLDALVSAGTIEAMFACVPSGQGERLGIDRDEDGLLDGLEKRRGTLASDPDTDDDGYDDALELALGGDPTRFDDVLAADVTAPLVTNAEARDVFADTATVHLVLDEAGEAQLDVGLAAGTYDLGGVVDTDLRRVHDLVLTGLPAGTTLFYRVTTADKNGNTSVYDDSFVTAPPLYHVADMTLEASATAPYTLTARVTVIDQAGEPVVGIPVKLMWAGDLGGLNFNTPGVSTDPTGVATHTFGPFTPAGPTTVTTSVMFIGSNVDGHEHFIGRGGDNPVFFYNQSSNAVNYLSVDLP